MMKGFREWFRDLKIQSMLLFAFVLPIADYGSETATHMLAKLKKGA